MNISMMDNVLALKMFDECEFIVHLESDEDNNPTSIGFSYYGENILINAYKKQLNMTESCIEWRYDSKYDFESVTRTTKGLFDLIHITKEAHALFLKLVSQQLVVLRTITPLLKNVTSLVKNNVGSGDNKVGDVLALAALIALEASEEDLLAIDHNPSTVKDTVTMGRVITASGNNRDMLTRCVGKPWLFDTTTFDAACMTTTHTDRGIAVSLIESSPGEMSAHILSYDKIDDSVILTREFESALLKAGGVDTRLTAVSVLIYAMSKVGMDTVTYEMYVDEVNRMVSIAACTEDFIPLYDDIESLEGINKESFRLNHELYPLALHDVKMAVLG